MLSIVCTVSSYAPPVAPAVATTRAASPSMETVDDLKTLSSKLNPAVGYYNPTPLVDMDFWGQGQAATIGFLRHAELKHGRIAMAAFVGYLVQANGIHFPWDLTTSGISFGDISAAGGPADQWDALPTNSKLSIIGAIGFLEWFGENGTRWRRAARRTTRGGKPGFYPSFKKGGILHPVPSTSSTRSASPQS